MNYVEDICWKKVQKEPSLERVEGRKRLTTEFTISLCITFKSHLGIMLKYQSIKYQVKIYTMFFQFFNQNSYTKLLSIRELQNICFLTRAMKGKIKTKQKQYLELYRYF